MREGDARRVVQFHTWDYTRNWESGITQARSSLVESAAFVQPLNHYTSSAVDQLNGHTLGLDRAFEQLGQLTEAITIDVKTVRRIRVANIAAHIAKVPETRLSFPAIAGTLPA